MKKLKISDDVIVLAGKNKGKTGKIRKINWKTQKVVIEGVNIMKKTVKPTQEKPDGDIIDIEAPLHISNINFLSPKNNKPTRVKIEVRDGKKVRVATSCGSVLS